MTTYGVKKALVKLASSPKQEKTEKAKSRRTALLAVGGVGAGTAAAVPTLAGSNLAFNRQLQKGRSDLINLMEYKRLVQKARDMGIEVEEGRTGHPVGPRFELYSNGKKRIVMEGVPSEAVLSHELGHARGNHALLRSKATLKKLSLLPGLGAAVSGVQTAQSSSSEEREKNLERLRNFGAGYAGLSAAPTLLEEARATGRSLLSSKNSQQFARRLKTLAPAYGTYVAGSLPALSIPVTAEILRRRELARRNSEG
jgi:hypothetical protein